MAGAKERKTKQAISESEMPRVGKVLGKQLLLTWTKLVGFPIILGSMCFFLTATRREEKQSEDERERFQEGSQRRSMRSQNRIGKPMR